jgi:hypothetical protein
MTDQSPSSLRKRNAKQPTNKLEEDIMGQYSQGSKARGRKDLTELDAIEQRLLLIFSDIDTILGPSMCGICDRDIGKSVKIKCLECTS